MSDTTSPTAEPAAVELMKRFNRLGSDPKVLPTTASHDEIAARLADGFELGVATAAYQIEGAVHEGGRGLSIWDTFSHTPGRVAGGDTGDIACDHYHRYAEDVRLMADLGIDSYRLSVAWPRIQPNGRGAANPAGLAFYDRLVDSLLQQGISPAVTLYHWDLPQALEDDGGWRNRETAQRFADYAAVVHDHLGDRVQRWITLNEPWCSSFLGYATGRHAPGAQEGEGALAAAHHLLLGHGLAVAALRADAREGLDGRKRQQVGITLNLQPVSSATDSPQDVEASQRALLKANLLFTDPVLEGRYPDLAWPTYEALTDFGYLHDGDLATIAAPLDFLGVNYYFPSRVLAVPHEQHEPALRTADDLGTKEVVSADEELTAMGWPVEPAGLTRLLVWLRDTYPTLPPIYITENGRASDDVVTPDGQVDDPDRVRYLDSHLRAAAETGLRGSLLGLEVDVAAHVDPASMASATPALCTGTNWSRSCSHPAGKCRQRRAAIPCPTGSCRAMTGAQRRQGCGGGQFVEAGEHGRAELALGRVVGHGQRGVRLEKRYDTKSQLSSRGQARKRVRDTVSAGLGCHHERFIWTYDAPMQDRGVTPKPSTANASSAAAAPGGGLTHPPRMEDVAHVAGVSHQTVSRVLNNVPHVRPATRDRVLAAIEELGYRRNIAARTLVTRRSGIIGVITIGMDQFGPANIIRGFESASRAAGYNLSLTALPEISAAAMRTSVGQVLGQAVEAVVMIVAHQDAHSLAQSLHIGVPLLLVEGDLSAPPLTAGVDQIAGARLATNHLLDLGHESVLHLPGPADWLDAAARRDGWQMALEERDRPVPPLMSEGDWTSRSGYEAGKALLVGSRPTAIFAANDQMALGLLRALHEAGLRVPEDVSVVGFDDLPESDFFSPPLTTISQDFRELGRRIMALILRVLAGELDAAVPLVEPRLIVRSSTAPPAG